MILLYDLDLAYFIFFQENGRSYLRHEQNAKQGVGSVRESEIGSGGALSQFLFESGSLLNDLAASQVTYEIGKMILPFSNLQILTLAWDQSLISNLQHSFSTFFISRNP